MDWTWSHATNSRHKVVQATEDSSIVAIECDVMVGTSIEDGESVSSTPILAHPPNTQSDISLATLILLLSDPTNDGKRDLRKHLKLDFKEIGVVQYSLQLLQSSNVTSSRAKMIFLNADILPGPGKRDDGTLPVPADDFLSCCLDHIHSRKVGFKTARKSLRVAPSSRTHLYVCAYIKLVRMTMFNILCL